MSLSENDLLFADHGESSEPTQHGGGARPISPWNVLVVDDEEDVHAITKIVLQEIDYAGRPVRLLHAYSASDAKALLAREPDIALVLLDVVMETEDAGLRLVRHIRETMKNKLTRIVLRTGQPGQAPERRVIADFDINDYKAKTELTAQKLYTTTMTALRAYEHVVAVEMSRRGLEKILEGASQLFQMQSLELFSAGVLTQMSALLGVSKDGILCVSRGGKHHPADELYVFAGSGRYELLSGSTFGPGVDEDVAELIRDTMCEGCSLYRDEESTLYFRTPNDREVVIYMRTDRPLAPLERQLVEVFSKQASIGMDNLHLFSDLRAAHEDLKLAHRATVLALADLAEYRDPDTGEHVLRVAQLTEEIAYRLRAQGHFVEQLDDTFVESIGLASIMHDVGKVTTPDRILQKAGPLERDERLVMQGHAEMGKRILARASEVAQGSAYLELGIQIAGHHHEWYDGTGYPDGIARDDIPLAARIVAIADVFDALTHRRIYKPAWSVAEAVAYIRERRGTQFDPLVVDAFLDILRDIGAVDAWATAVRAR